MKTITGSETQRGSLAGIGFSMISAVAFGTVAPLVKLAYERGADPLALLAVRFAIAAVFLFALAGARKVTVWRGGPLTRRLIALGAVGYAAESTLFFIALDIAPAGIVSLVFFSYPLITTVLSVVLRVEPVRKTTVVALAAGSAGVALIFNVEGVPLQGPLVALGAAMLVSLYFIAAARYADGVPAIAAGAWTALGAAATLGVLAPLVGHGVPLTAMVPAIGIGAVTTVAFASLYAALARIGTSRSAIAQMLEPVVTVALAALFLGELITFRVGIGAVLIVSALPLLAFSSLRRPPAADSL